MIIQSSGTSGNAFDAVSLRNGAVLAVNDLGSELISLTITDGKNNSTRTDTALNSISSANTRLVLVGPRVAGTSGALQKLSTTGVPVIVFRASQSGPGYSFLPSGFDGLSAGIRYLTGKGNRKALSFVPGSEEQRYLRFMQGNTWGGGFANSNIDYTPQTNLKDLVTKNRGAILAADTIILPGLGSEVAELTKHIRTLAENGSKISILARTDLPTTIKTRPEMSNVLTAEINLNSVSLLRERYSKAFNSQINATAAYSYDTVAIAAGLLRNIGTGGISKANLESKSGFTASTGSFRLRSDGRVERLYEITRWQSGKREVVSPAPKGF